ncbi:hypothetical protein M9H77_11866 [Catharanthus roseus]|uniref:Uncharacterized protein n=1 Tax=Catharanthus roseus TaxID=4058 RepID=A0ACC0BFX9_CATRO|nr:hypothetical protein M9H77_11866 [Catharanthus roseus]
MKPRVDDEKEEEVQVKRRGPNGTKKCSCLFKLKGDQMAMCESWQLFVHDGRHKHIIVPRKYTTSLPRLRGIGCRSETRSKKYNMPLLEVVGMTPTARIPKEIGCSEDEVAEKAKLLTLFVHYLSLDRLGNSFWVDTNRAESEHAVLKLWLLTCHDDLDTVFLNIDSLIQSQIAGIKSSLENSRTKEKFNAKSNPILRNISNKIITWPLKKI